MSEREGGLLGVLTKLFKKKPEAVIVGEARPPAQRQIPTEAEHAKGGGQKTKPEEAKKSTKPEVAAAVPAAAPKAEAPTEQQALRDRLQEAAMAEHKLPYEKLSVRVKLKLLNEQLREQPDPNAAAFKTKLEELQKIQWEQPTPEQWQQVKRTFGDMPEKLELPEAERAVLTHVQLAVARQVEDNLPKYDLGERGLTEIAKALKFPEVRGGAGPARPGGKIAEKPDWVKNNEEFFSEQAGAAHRHDVTTGPLNNETRQELEKINRVLRANPAIRDDARTLGNLIQDLEKSAKISGVNPDQLRPYIVDLAQQYQHNFDVQIEEQARERPFATFYLPEETKSGMLEHPEVEIENALQEVEEFSRLFEDTPGAQSAVGKIRQMTDYMMYAQYETDVNRYIQDMRDHAGWTDEQAAAHLRNTVGKRKEMSDKVNVRMAVHRAHSMYAGIGDPETVKKSLLSVGVGGLHYMLNEHDGLVGVGLRTYTDVHAHWRWRSGSDDLLRYTGEQLAKVNEAAVEAFWAERDLYNPRFRAKWKRDMTKKDARAIIRMARELHGVTQQEAVSMGRGLAPGEDINDVQFEVASSAEGLLGIWQLYRWKLQRWFLLSPGARGFIDADAEFAAHAQGLHKIVKERIREARNNPAALKLLKKETFNIFGIDDITEEGRKQIKGRLAQVFQFDANGNRIKHPPKRLEDVTEKQLEYRMLLKEGMNFFETNIMMYDYFSSGYIVTRYIKQMDGIWTYGENLGLGFRLRKVGGDLLGAEKDEDIKNAKLALLGVQNATLGSPEEGLLRKIARLRPQALIEFHLDHDYQAVKDLLSVRNPGHDFVDRVRAAFPHRGATGAEITHVSELIREIQRHYMPINELLAHHGLPPIDYSLDYSNFAALTGIQKRQLVLIREVCHHQGTDMDRYLKIMKEMSEFVHEDRHINVLVERSYYDIYRRTQFIDDARLDRLNWNIEGTDGRAQLIDHIKEWTKTDKRGGELDALADFGPLSSKLGGEEEAGPGDALVRAWGDTVMGQKAAEAFMATMTTDPEKLVKALVDYKVAIRDIYGAPWNIRAPIYVLAGWLKTAKTDNWKDWFFLNGLENSSIQKRLISADANSMGLNEMKQVMEAAEKELMTKLELVAPELAGEMKVWLGMATKLPGGEEPIDAQLWFYRSRLFIILAGVLIATQTAKIAQEQLGGTKS